MIDTTVPKTHPQRKQMEAQNRTGYHLTIEFIIKKAELEEKQPAPV
jgi:hypothetical protein